MASPFRVVRKAAVAGVGGATVVTGIILLPLPGPGSLVILAGLAILSTEFRFAQRVLERARAELRKKLNRKGSKEEDPDRHPAQTS